MGKRKFVIGDIHGQLSQLLTLERYLQEDCQKSRDDYEIIFTGDIMNGGNQSFELFKYVSNNPKITQLLGNNDEFFFRGDVEADPWSGRVKNFGIMGMAEALSVDEKRIGFIPTWKNIIDYYNNNELTCNRQNVIDFAYNEFGYFLPGQKLEPDETLLFNVKYIYDTIFKTMLVENPKLLQKISKTYLTGDDKFTAEEDLKEAGRVFDSIIYGSKQSTNYSAEHSAVKHKSRYGDGWADTRLGDKYSDLDLKCYAFLFDQMREMQKYFLKLPVILQVEQNSKKYVMTHSGYVPYDENGKILTEDKKQNINRYIQTQHNENETIINYTQKDGKHIEQQYKRWGQGEHIVTFEDGIQVPEKKVRDIYEWPHNYSKEKIILDRGDAEGAVRKTRIDDHIVIHGHVVRNESKPADVCYFKNGELQSVNLDGGAKDIKQNQIDSSVLRCIELGTERIITINGVNEIKEKTIYDYGISNLNPQNIATIYDGDLSQ